MSGMQISVAVVVLVIAAVGVNMFRSGSGGESSCDRVGCLECQKMSGLPGAAAGKEYYHVGKLDAGRVIAWDNRVHEAGDRVFVDYCDANGHILFAGG